MPAELVQECVVKGSALIQQSVFQMANDYFLRKSLLGVTQFKTHLEMPTPLEHDASAKGNGVWQVNVDACRCIRGSPHPYPCQFVGSVNFSDLIWMRARCTDGHDDTVQKLDDNICCTTDGLKSYRLVRIKSYRPCARAAFGSILFIFFVLKAAL